MEPRSEWNLNEKAIVENLKNDLQAFFCCNIAFILCVIWWLCVVVCVHHETNE